jgi:outer membrane murein-binding lipoprotein Lpp
MKKVAGIVAAFVAASVFVAGCGSTASETKPIAEVQSEAKTMSASQLEKMVNTYKAAIDAKQVQVKALQDKIKTIPVTQLLGDEARAIKDDVSKLTSSVQALTERMNVYVKELQAKQVTVKQ